MNIAYDIAEVDSKLENELAVYVVFDFNNSCCLGKVTATDNDDEVTETDKTLRT